MPPQRLLAPETPSLTTTESLDPRIRERLDPPPRTLEDVEAPDC